MNTPTSAMGEPGKMSGWCSSGSVVPLKALASVMSVEWVDSGQIHLKSVDNVVVRNFLHRHHLMYGLKLDLGLRLHIHAIPLLVAQKH